MTPEARAARDRLLGLLSANGSAAVIDEAVDADLRIVLAALDEQERALAFLDRSKDFQAAVDQANQQAADAYRPRSIDPGMGILGPSYEERRDAYRAARCSHCGGRPQMGPPCPACGTTALEGVQQ